KSRIGCSDAMRIRRTAVIGLALAAAAGLARADDEIVADRPGFGESANVVASRHVQVEIGATWTQTDPIDDVFDLAKALVRIGLGHSLELRFDTPDWLYARDAGVRSHGFSDTTVGLKWHASIGSSDLSLRGAAVVPSGSVGFTDEDVDPTGAIAWSR